MAGSGDNYLSLACVLLENMDSRSWGQKPGLPRLLLFSWQMPEFFGVLFHFMTDK